jgi:hypothetical protein
MAETPKIAPLTDFSKVNPYGVREEQLADLQDTLQEQIKSLENRYAQPNWFKIAAGFAKPQLGGFMASLGSAAEAHGDTVEQQRAMALPIAQMRSQLAQSNVLMGQNKTQSDEFTRWQSTGKPMDQQTYARITGFNPTSAVAAAAKAAYEGGSKDIENTRAQQRAILDSIGLKQAKGMPLNKTEQNFLENFASGLINAPEASRASGMVPPAGTPPTVNPATAPTATPVAGAAPVAAAPQQTQPSKDVAEEPKKFVPYKPTFAFPDVSNMADPERKSREAAYDRNVTSAESKSEAQVQQWKSLAADPIYSSVDSEYKSAINLLKSEPEVSKKVFNLLRGGGNLYNQAISAAQAGFGVNLGSMAANINLPIEAFARAGLNEEQQLMADRLVRAMLVVGNAKLVAQGITPEKGQESYKQYMEGTKASLQQNPATALHNLEKDYLSFQQTKKLYDQTTKEHRLQQEHSVTPYTDVINNSPEIQRINAESRQRMLEQEDLYKSAIKQRADMRKKNQGG